MTPCHRCTHEQRHHGRGTGKCWAPNMRCTCPAYVKPPLVETEYSATLHRLEEDDVTRAVAAGVLVPVHRLTADQT